MKPIKILLISVGTVLTAIVLAAVAFWVVIILLFTFGTTDCGPGPFDNWGPECETRTQTSETTSPTSTYRFGHPQG